MFKPTLLNRILFFILGDVILSFVTLLLSYDLRFNFSIPHNFYNNFLQIYLIIIAFKITIYFTYKLYFASWRFFSIIEVRKFIISTTITYFTLFLFFQFVDILVPRSVLIIDYILTLVVIGLFKVSKRLFFEKIDSSKTKAIVIGANEKTISVLKNNDYSIIAIYDDDKKIIGSYIYGLKVLPLSHISSDTKTLIITKTLSQEKLDELFETLTTKGFDDIKIYNPFEKSIKDISIEDLLARKPKDLDTEAIEEFIRNKTILITGAGGSIGSELVRQCHRFQATKVILLDHSEYNLYKISEEFPQSIKSLINVVNYEDLQRVFELHTPQIVLHAAAYKHVPLCEENPHSAVVNNIIGTKNCIDLAIKYNVDKFVLISTDKAVRPTNVMGATKRVCELYAQNVVSTNTEIVAVRFGNVLGSSGSVVPKFKQLIQQNKKLTITHPEITRYFMLIPEACQLVLQAGSMAKGGEIFILDMGEPVKIVDLAKKMLKLYGKDENDIIFTGLREGEKLYEELLLDEADKTTKYKSIFVAKPTFMDINSFKERLELLQTKTTKKQIIDILLQIGVEFMNKK